MTHWLVKKKLSNLTFPVFRALGLLLGIFACPRIVIDDALLNILPFSSRGKTNFD